MAQITKSRVVNRGMFLFSLSVALLIHGIACALILSNSQSEPKILVSYVSLHAVLESMGEGQPSNDDKGKEIPKLPFKKETSIKKNEIKKNDSDGVVTGQGNQQEQKQGEPGSSKENGRRFLQKYIRQVVIMVNGKKFYPKESQKMKEQGLAIVLLTLDKSGKPLGIKLKSSSGYSKLDEASLRAINSVSMFPAFPDEVMQSRMVIEIPMRYKL